MAGDIKDIANASERLVAKFENVSNNLANVDTIGFKEEFLKSIARYDLPNQADNQAGSRNTSIKMTQGMIQQTGNRLDVALDGDGFFAIQTPDGELYTRKGNFNLNKNAEIVTSAGDAVSGGRGPIVARGKDIQIDRQGSVTVDGAQVGTLKVVTFDQPDLLEKTGNGMFKDPGTAGMKAKQDPNIIPKSVELSNVNAIQQMVTMIDIQRTLEIYQKLILAITEQDKISTSRVGRLV